MYNKYEDWCAWPGKIYLIPLYSSSYWNIRSSILSFASVMSFLGALPGCMLPGRQSLFSGATAFNTECSRILLDLVIYFHTL